MDIVSTILQVIVGISILNVWLVQSNKATQWRGGEATTLSEEFQVYGLPGWSLYLVGAIKVVLALMLILGIWYPDLVYPGAIGLAIMLTGSVIMHIKIGDPWLKSFPAALFLVMCLLIAFVL